jgi:cation diffusion facilitator family transporter
VSGHHHDSPAYAPSSRPGSDPEYPQPDGVADPGHSHPHPRGRGHSHDHDGHEHHDHGHPAGVKGFFRSVFAPHSHDAADSVDSALESSREGVRALKISLVVLMATAVAQLIIVLFTGSVALLADTIHNFSDALTAVPLWIAFVLARRPATRRFTYGYGRAEDLAGLFIVAMIALSAIVAGYESVRRLVDPVPISSPWVVLAAGVVGFAGNEIVALYRIRVGRKIGSAALVADGLHARTDGFTSLAVAVGAVGVLAGLPLADPVVGVIITVAILAVLRGAVVEVFRRLLDGVEPALVAAAEREITGSTGVVGIRRLRMRWDGHRLTADADIDVDPDVTLGAARDIAHAVEHRLTAVIPKLVVADVHPHPRDVHRTQPM